MRNGQMRSVLVLGVLAALASGYEDWEAQFREQPYDYMQQLQVTPDDPDPFDENDSIDSIFEKKAYFAFKLRNEKLERRVLLIQEMSKQKSANQWGYGSGFDPKESLNSSFVLPSQLELRLSGFYYDEAEHRERFPAVFSEVARSLCNSYPGYLTFSRFVVDYGMIRGLLQDVDVDEQPIKKILGKYGFTRRAGSDIASGDYSGFVAVREHRFLKKDSIRELLAAAKIFLQKPLRTSVHVDTLYACTENAAGYCDEIASIKINCDSQKVDL